MNTTPSVVVPKRALLFGLSVLLLFGAILLGAGCRSSPPEDEVIRLGAILPLTGEAAQYGKNDREGIDLAVSLANEAGGIDGRRIEVSYEDCRTDAKTALAAFTKLRAAGVSLFIDNAISTISLAMVPLLEQNQSVLMSTGASNPALSGSSPWFFRIWNSDSFEGRIAAEYLLRVAPEARVAILYINSDYGKGLQQVFSGILAGAAARIVAAESFEKDTRDFRSQIAKIRAASPTHIYLVGYGAQTGPATRQIREAGVQAAIIGTVAMEDAGYLALAGPASEGVVYPFARAPQGEAVEKFKDAFRARYAREPELLHDCGFDAANLFIEAFRGGARSAAEVRAFLANLRGFPGASGEISFDANGDVSKPMEMRVIRDGEFVPLTGSEGESGAVPG
ncbi:MAG: hypothetical protein BWY99_02326 [Synergistetes bacterium ADurb.BinA166]|nr:MAG: hypothetical protein BWY99_02326 [Synergistetes bacterium ADurb.BinA166]